LGTAILKKEKLNFDKLLAVGEYGSRNMDYVGGRGGGSFPLRGESVEGLRLNRL